MVTKTWVIYAEFSVAYEGDTLIGLYHATDEGLVKAKRECEEHNGHPIKWEVNEWQNKEAPYKAETGNGHYYDPYYLCCVEVT